MVSCKACGYEGEAPWDIEHRESGQWPCLQCGRHWPFLDFERLWLMPGRSIEYSGSVDWRVAVDFPHILPPLTPITRVWRRCGEDQFPCRLHSDPESRSGDDFGWGLHRYRADRLFSLNLAHAILCDFYGWLSWADAEIAFEPYSKKRWAKAHAPAFLAQTIVQLPAGKSWTIGDADLQLAFRRIMPASFPSP